ncbi:septal ring lytic transglycosylase RlpA family protein [Nonomuraea roseola]|uniref:Probable endolytic peptidoglycan transglycosylase RlpA n=1 Tax=Nonomuraea roseola TaxID=46179 RepID=A0ABV5Q7E5_9ACTN
MGQHSSKPSRHNPLSRLTAPGRRRWTTVVAGAAVLAASTTAWAAVANDDSPRTTAGAGLFATLSPSASPGTSSGLSSGTISRTTDGTAPATIGVTVPPTTGGTVSPTTSGTVPGTTGGTVPNTTGGTASTPASPGATATSPDSGTGNSTSTAASKGVSGSKGATGSKGVTGSKGARGSEGADTSPDGAQAKVSQAPKAVAAPAKRKARVLSSGRCGASYYDEPQMTASGERFNPSALTAAHKSLPLGSKVRVINPSNGKAVVVRINDRGPYTGGRCLDLSEAAFSTIGDTNAGVMTVKYQVLAS